MTEAEARVILARHLWLCDLAGRGNGEGSNAWRDAATAIRTVVPGLLADRDAGGDKTCHPR